MNAAVVHSTYAASLVPTFCANKKPVTANPKSVAITGFLFFLPHLPDRVTWRLLSTFFA